MTFLIYKKEIEFICPIEKIPTSVVEMLDKADQIDVDTSVPPRFDCENCYGKMVPTFYIEVKGKVYKYED